MSTPMRWHPLLEKQATIPSKSSASEVKSLVPNLSSATNYATNPESALLGNYDTEDEADENAFKSYLAQAQSLTHANVSSPNGGKQPSQQYIDSLYKDGKISEKQYHELRLRLGV